MLAALPDKKKPGEVSISERTTSTKPVSKKPAVGLAMSDEGWERIKKRSGLTHHTHDEHKKPTAAEAKIDNVIKKYTG